MAMPTAGAVSTARTQNLSPCLGAPGTLLGASPAHGPVVPVQSDLRGLRRHRLSQILESTAFRTAPAGSPVSGFCRSPPC